MRGFGIILWCVLFFAPLLIMVLLDGFCSGKELCHAGLSFTLLVYAGGILAFAAAVLIARLAFTALRTGASGRVRTMKALFILPLIPALGILGLLLANLFGGLG